ncbi:MerR family transcriptional regulator [Streptomyces hoynatensis]|uniref:MerR family transcriptional regulator n=1 Tax=Streptomyces hoynatensis TaxID=1141874 RepID=A0A3A9YLA8_9ACTN|nr:MerR family transcriptional regulator [Streptomyces hoynatensis]RKN37183.1 MerR family transcriptional regulator [Streptomyces hoynatensis]
MLIGELSRRTGVSERLLRYYEERELIRAERRANGYREYGEEAEQAVRRIRALLAAGLPLRVVRQILPCSSGEAGLRPCPGVLASLHGQLAVLERRAAELDAARRLLRRTIDVTERAADGGAE